MIQTIRTGAIALTLLTLAAGLARAEDPPQQVGTFQDWVAYTVAGSDGTLCYVTSTPKTSEPKNIRRDQPFFLVTNKTGGKTPVKGEVSTIIGYPFKEGQVVKLKVDDTDFDMFSQGDTAWVDNSADKKVVAAMKQGKSLTVVGTSSRGKVTTDTYSLQGISAALAAIDKACK